MSSEHNYLNIFPQIYTHSGVFNILHLYITYFTKVMKLFSSCFSLKINLGVILAGGKKHWFETLKVRDFYSTNRKKGGEKKLPGSWGIKPDVNPGTVENMAHAECCV